MGTKTTNSLSRNWENISKGWKVIMNYRLNVSHLLRAIATLIIIYIIFNSVIEFYSIASQIGSFTIQWKLAFLGFIVICGVVYISTFTLLWWPSKAIRFNQVLAQWRKRLRQLRILIIGLVLFLPPWLLQYTKWGNIFDRPFLHLFLFGGEAIIVGVLLCKKEKILASFTDIVVGLLLSGSAFSFISALVGVTDCPLSLFWSEGNRIWDYSILFGRNLYDYPPGQPIYAYIDLGRQILWGLPFLLPGVSILVIRLWDSLLSSIPYAILGWAMFYPVHLFSSTAPKSRTVGIWILCGLWTFVFLYQTGIYTPLVFSAILVAIAWTSSAWIAFPLIALSAYYATITRYTWMFAPALWAGMLVPGETIPGTSFSKFINLKTPWGRFFLFTSAGLLGTLINLFQRKVIGVPENTNWWAVGSCLVVALIIFIIHRFEAQKRYIELLWKGLLVALSITAIVSVFIVGEGVLNSVRTTPRQPLLWYRLFPNLTYPPGILLGFLIVVGPLITLLLYCVWKGRWQLDLLQRISILGTLLVFLGVGIVASVKIGGGGDLHNLDMFFIGLLIVAGLAWRAGGNKLIEQSNQHSIWIKTIIILLIVIPVLQPILNIRPLEIPSDKEANNILGTIQTEIDHAKSEGDILFMDQRQLLTFGYIKNTPLIPEYEKKLVMDQAMSGNSGYFKQFYEDLARHRFSLIISDLLKVDLIKNKKNIHRFDSENDVWVQWVAEPILRFYKPIVTYKKWGLQLLIPNDK